ncbi:MAG TPA: hypothetical protein VGN17_05110 [Bryobacteraceae bacterium]
MKVVYIYRGQQPLWPGPVPQLHQIYTVECIVERPFIPGLHGYVLVEFGEPWRYEDFLFVPLDYWNAEFNVSTDVREACGDKRTNLLDGFAKLAYRGLHARGCERAS